MAPRKSIYPDDMRIAIVQALATWKRSPEIQAMVKERWGYDVTPQYIEGHNPERAQSAQLARRFVELFHSARKAYIDNVHAVPIANRVWRMSVYQETVELALKQKNTKMVLATLEQSAKEMGDQFTNKQVISGIHGILTPAQQPATVDEIESVVRKVRDEF